MLLTFDIGNIYVNIGVYKDDKLIAHWDLTADRNRCADEYRILIKQLLTSSDIELEASGSAIISSVVPPLTATFQRVLNELGLKTMLVGPGIKTGVSVKLDYPRELGADRIAGAAAGYSMYGGPLIIVDFGTATSFSVLSKKGEYVGSVIAPGVSISMEALYSNASKLPRIELEKPPYVIGKNTVNSMQAGFLYGFVGMTREIIARINEERGEAHRVIATGQLSELIAPELPEIHHIDTLLTLKGLKLIYDKNK